MLLELKVNHYALIRNLSFAPINFTLTLKSSGFPVTKPFSPKINTYDLTFILNFRKSWKFLYIESGYSFGLGYKKWDFGYDQELYTNALKRFEDKWMHLQVPFRVHLRAGIRL
jgi:hypothetical protein